MSDRDISILKKGEIKINRTSDQTVVFAMYTVLKKYLTNNKSHVKNYIKI